MRRHWNEIKDHRLAAGVFLLYWVVVYGLHVCRWNAQPNTPDVVRPVLELHLLLPVIAGALVSWWRGSRRGGITDGMLGGAVVLVIDSTLVVWDFEIVPLLIALGVLGSLLGVIGASGSAALRHLLSGWQKPTDGLPLPDLANQPAADGGEGPAEDSPLVGIRGIIPRWMLLLAAGLCFGVAVIVALGVIPPVRTDTFARAVPESAATAFAVTSILNALVGIALLALVSRRNIGAGKVLAVVAGVVALLLGSALLDAAGAFAGHGPSMRAVVVTCFACAAGDLGAGVLAFIAAFRRHGKVREEYCDAAQPRL